MQLTSVSTVPDADRGRELRELLSRTGFDGVRLPSLLGVTSAAATRSMPRSELLRRLQPQACSLWRLLVVGDSLPEQATHEALGVAAVDLLREAHVVQRVPSADGAVLRAGISLAPVEGLLIASDRWDVHGHARRDYVIGAGPSSRALAQLLITRPVETALDLGCGSGYLACRMAPHAGHVVATDVNPRAVAFARFNAALNQLDNVEARQGSLFAPVAAERFDQIVCNPPYVISPASTFLYRDGEDDICRRIATSALQHLTSSGTLQLAAHWAQRANEDWRQDVRSWFDGDEQGAWVLSGTELDVATYAEAWVRQQIGDSAGAGEEIERWLQFYRQHGIERIAAGYLMLRWAERGRGWFEVDALPPIAGAAGESIARGIAARELLASLETEAELLQARLLPSPGLQRVERSRLAASGFERTSLELRLERGLRFAARVDPLAPRVLAELDGERTLAQAGARVAAALGKPPSTFDAGLPALARKLLRLGIVTIAEARGTEDTSRRA